MGADWATAGDHDPPGEQADGVSRGMGGSLLRAAAHGHLLGVGELDFEWASGPCGGVHDAEFAAGGTTNSNLLSGDHAIGVCSPTPTSGTPTGTRWSEPVSRSTRVRLASVSPRRVCGSAAVDPSGEIVPG